MFSESDANSSDNLPAFVAFCLIFLGILIGVSFINYQLFHAVVELASVVVGVSISALAWNSRYYSASRFFTVFGIALLGSSCLDLMHTLTYKGMGVLPGYGTNSATQLWIAARFLHSISLVVALLLINRPVKPAAILGGYSLAVAALLWSILYARIFPDCFLDGTGLTPFKKYSELVICLVFGIGMLLLRARRQQFSGKVYVLLQLSVLAAICAEFAFIFYVNVYGFSNMVGHVFKLTSFSLLYLGVIHTGLRDPLAVVFHELKQKDDQLVALNGQLLSANELLEQRVAERTADLNNMVEELHQKTSELEVEVAERQKAQEELKVAMEMAKAANRAKSSFLANMSHELRTPLNGVVGMAQLLDMTEVTDEQKEYLGILKTSADNLLSLINDILDITKIEAENYSLNNAEYSLRDAVAEVVKMQRRGIDEKGLKLSLELPDEIPDAVTGDRVRFMQILSNLLSNAVKFTEQGGVQISASVREYRDSALLLEIVVTDTGIGISPEFREHIFENFTQVDESYTRKYGGAGLGLAICSKLVELMGGDLWVESTERQGSSFHLMLPFVVPSCPNAVEEYRRTSEEDGIFAATHALPVLVAEDNPANMRYARKLLEKLGCQVTEVTDGRQALAEWERGDFKLILMDIQMPELRGDEVVKAIRQREQDTRIPIIAVTAHALNGDRERFLEAGCDEYVAKPFQMETLADAIRRLVVPDGQE